ncbi:MAG TPA: LptF/LptG family permease, partial [Gemmatimonadales bacterium]|nr:LptF/LptG family permease [Gemmatimonadales bacterium]
MVRPALIAAVFVAAVNFMLFDQMVPISNTRFRTLRADVQRKTPTLALRSQSLNELPPTGYVLRAREITNETGELSEVSIWDLRHFDGRRVIHADSGLMAQSPDGTDLVMTLFDGEILDFSNREPTRVERTAFRVNLVTIADVQRDLERRTGQLERGDREKSGCELLDGIDESEWALANARQLRERLTRRDLRHLLDLPPLPPAPVQPRPTFQSRCGQWRSVQELLERIFLPAEVAAETPPGQDPQQPQDPPRPAEPVESMPPRNRLGQRLDDSVRRQLQLERARARQPAEVAGDTTVPIQEPQEQFSDSATPEPLSRPDDDPFVGGPGFLVDPDQGPGFGAPRADGMVTSMVEVSGARMQAAEALQISRSFDVEFHKKFAIPFGSFCFVLIGVALALKFPGSGIGLVIGGSLLIFLAFYVMLIGGENLADEGVISAELAMYGPAVLFALAGLAAVASANREMGSTRSTGIGEMLRGLFRRKRDR